MFHDPKAAAAIADMARALQIAATALEGVLRNGTDSHAVNINGTALYRPLSGLGDDMLRVVGKSSFLL